jgi:hypothetical protein
MAGNKVQTLRSSTAGARPTGRKPGELYVNFADNALGYIDAAGNPVDIGLVKVFDLPIDPSETTDPTKQPTVDLPTTWKNLAVKPTGAFIVNWRNRVYSLTPGTNGTDISHWTEIADTGLWDWALLSLGDYMDISGTFAQAMAKLKGTEQFFWDTAGNMHNVAVNGTTDRTQMMGYDLTPEWSGCIRGLKTLFGNDLLVSQGVDGGLYDAYAGAKSSNLEHGVLITRATPPDTGLPTGLGAEYKKAKARIWLDETTNPPPGTGGDSFPYGNVILTWGNHNYLRVNGSGELDSHWVWVGRATLSGGGGAAAHKKQLLSISGILTPPPGSPAGSAWFGLNAPNGVTVRVKEAADSALFVMDGNFPKATRDCYVRLTLRVAIKELVLPGGVVRFLPMDMGVIANKTDAINTAGLDNDQGEGFVFSFFPMDNGAETVQAVGYFRVPHNSYLSISGIEHTKADDSNGTIATEFAYDLIVEEL